jgi:hypothetical protein
MADNEASGARSGKDRSSGTGRSGSKARSSGTGRSGSNRRSAGFSASDAARRASEELEQLTKTPVERVTGVQRNDGDGWVVVVEGLELHRVPPTMDVLASYEVELSARGEVVAWQRVGRYHRAQVEG